MQYQTPNFTKEMMKDYTLLVPDMAPVHFRLIKAALESEGYHKVVMIGSCSPDVLRLGLKYVHNDTCYPALLIIGQFLEALESGEYDLDHTAMLISQSGGGCRASNYIRLLRKALVNAGHGNIPVASINPSGLEKGSQLPITLRMLMKVLMAAEYGDLLMALRDETAPYEIHAGETDRLLDSWLDRLETDMHANRNCTPLAAKKMFNTITEEFSRIERDHKPRVKVGVVGEIYVKFSPYGNNDLRRFLEQEDCETCFPGLMGYVEYCCANMKLDTEYYGISPAVGKIAGILLKWLDSIGHKMSAVLAEYGYRAPISFYDLMKLPEGILDLGTKMGEGWLLTAEMTELIESGYANIICVQPFGCLPNHIAGKGVINRLRERYPETNITPIDYDPGATRVNQENRIKLMLAVAKERLQTSAEKTLLPAE